MRRATRDGMSGKGGGGGMTRRQTLGAAGAAGAGLFLAGAGGKLAGLGGGDEDEAVAAAAKTCLRLTPEQEEGPFYVDLGRVRADVVEGEEGVPLDLRVRVIDHAALRAGGQTPPSISGNATPTASTATSSRRARPGRNTCVGSSSPIPPAGPS